MGTTSPDADCGLRSQHLHGSALAIASAWHNRDVTRSLSPGPEDHAEYGSVTGNAWTTWGSLRADLQSTSERIVAVGQDRMPAILGQEAAFGKADKLYEFGVVVNFECHRGNIRRVRQRQVKQKRAALPR